jgi:hypothetical protein
VANALDRTTSFLPLVVISVLLHVIGGTQASIAIEATERREGREAEVIGKPPSIQCCYTIGTMGHELYLLSYGHLEI